MPPPETDVRPAGPGLQRRYGLKPGLLLPPLATVVAWSAWALGRAQAEAWAAMRIILKLGVRNLFGR